MIISLSNAYNINSTDISGIKRDTPSQIEKKMDIIYTDMSIGDATKGKEIFEKKIKFFCGISDDDFLPIHTQDEWEAIAQAGKFKEEIFRICPKLKKIYQDKWSANLYQFVYEYAIDSGNIP